MNHLKIDNQKAKKYIEAINSSSIITITDRHGIIKYANSNFCKISGYSEDELIGKPHNIVRHKSMPKEIFAQIWKDITNKQTWSGVITNRKKNGEFYIVESTIIPILDENGEIEEYISIRKDITDYVKLEKLNKYQATLSQHKNDEYTKKLSTLRDRMMMLFSHELKTPINALINITDILAFNMSKEGILSPEKGEMLNALHENSITLYDQIENILCVAEFNKHKSDKNLEYIDIKNLIQEVLSMYKTKFITYNVKVTVDIEDVSLYCNKKDFELLIRNLIANSIKYGNKEISIVLKKDTILKKFFFIIEDNGTGIEDLSSAFKLFEQLEEQNLKRQKSGLGIGLYLVNLICKYMNYSINITRSKSLGGTSFCISGNLNS